MGVRQAMTLNHSDVRFVPSSLTTALNGSGDENRVPRSDYDSWWTGQSDRPVKSLGGDPQPKKIVVGATHLI